MLVVLFDSIFGGYVFSSLVVGYGDFFLGYGNFVEIVLVFFS